MKPSKLQELDAEVKEKIRLLPTESRKVIDEVNKTFDEMNKDIFDFDSENRVRKAGFTPQEAEDIANITKKVKVGQVFTYKTKRLVLTPFKTVVSDQAYITALQDRLLEITSESIEVQVIRLTRTINSFTSLSFFGLIKLAFKKLLKGDTNG